MLRPTRHSSIALLCRATDAAVERAVLIYVVGFDWNCQQHITPRWTEEELAEEMEPVRRRVAALEAEIAALQRQLGVSPPPVPVDRSV